MTFEYVDRCIEVVQSMDAEVLAQAQKGAFIAESTSTQVWTFPGRLASGLDLPLALKVPITKQGGYRLQKELIDISLILDRIPELLPEMPYFLGRIATPDIEELAVITEDASRGRQAKVNNTSLSAASRRLFKERFADIGTFQSVFSMEDVLSTMPFEVDGTERLLDFTPSPFQPARRYKLPGFSETVEYIEAHMADLTIAIPNETPLARDVSAVQIF